MTTIVPKLRILLPSAILIISLSACESNGSTRFSSVSSRGPQGAQGVAGPQGPAGAQGPQGMAGPQGPAGSPGAAGAAGSGLGLGPAGALAVGGLVGPNGIAGTGLLANTGDPNNRIPAVSGVLVASGGAVRTVAGQGTILANIVDANAPGAIPVAGTVIGVVDATGQALIKAGNGQQYLVDGLTAAPGQLVNVTLGNAQVLGSSNQSALIGASVLSSNQAEGSVLTVGVGAEGQLLTVNNSASGGGQTGGNPVSGVVETVSGLQSGSTGQTAGTGGQTGGGAPIVAPVPNAVGGLTGLVGGGTGQ